MTNLSPVVGWGVPVLGAVLAMLIGSLFRRLGGEIGVLGCIFFAFVLSVILLPISATIHSAFIARKLCGDSGEGNMAYWLIPIYACPIYAILIGTFAAGGSKPSASSSDEA
jgi:hypothetical protein